jgi:class 3 adenylate cyclase
MLTVRGSARCSRTARPAEILVSRTVKDLVTGSGITFAERGSHRLNGAADEWPLFAVTGFEAARGRDRGRAELSDFGRGPGSAGGGAAV